MDELFASARRLRPLAAAVPNPDYPIGTAAGRTLDWHPRLDEGFYYYPASARMNMLSVGGYIFESPPPEVSQEGKITVNPPPLYRYTIHDEPLRPGTVSALLTRLSIRPVRRRTGEAAVLIDDGEV